MRPVRVVVLGAGFGGLELSTRLSDEFGDDLDIVLIDKGEGFVFGFSKLDVMFGRKPATDVVHPYHHLDKAGLTFVRATVTSIDPRRKHVQTDAGDFDADILVVALGADLDGDATPGLRECGGEFYTVESAFALRDTLQAFEGGRVVVGVTSTPFKCPPAPSETALLMHDFLVERGIRDRSSIALVMPLGVPIPPSPAASQALLSAFAERDISWHPERLVTSIDPDARVLTFSDGSTMAFDLFLGVPKHVAPPVVEASGLTVDGWIPVDPRTLETAFPDVYAVGDVTSVGTPKAGVFSEGQAAVAAAQIGARIRGEASGSSYDGTGTCYLEFGHDQVARVTVTFLSGQAPVGDLEGPSLEIAADKGAFGSTRIRRWFDRPWS